MLLNPHTVFGHPSVDMYSCITVHAMKCILLLHILQSYEQLHWRQSTGHGKESESQPLTTEPEVRAELCMSFSGESEGGEERGGKGSSVVHDMVM